MQTKNMKFGQLGNVLSAHNPIRLAEDIAMVDQMLGGRTFAGFARGYQPRWVATPGQQNGDMANEPEIGTGAYDALKKELYYDHFEIIKKRGQTTPSLTAASIGKFRPLTLPGRHHGVTRKYGQGVDENGILTEISIAPSTYNKRMLESFRPFGFNGAVANPGESPFDVQNDFETMEERGLVICGSPDTVKRKLEQLFIDLLCDYFWLFTCNGLVSQKNMMRHFELLTEQVLPHFTDKIK